MSPLLLAAALGIALGRAPPATVDVLASSRRAPRETLPAGARDIIKLACGPGAAIGPLWHTDLGTYVAATGWDAGESQACLVLVETAPGAPQLVAWGLVPAGWSDRYQEFFAPRLLPRPLVVAGHAPFPVFEVTTMGIGGGGGRALYVALPRGEDFQLTALGSIGGATNINFVVETQGRCQDKLEAGARDAQTLRLTQCFDGAPSTACFGWNGAAYQRRVCPSR